MNDQNDGQLIIQEKKELAESLIQQAIERGMPVENLEKLLVMRRELKAEWAKEQYYQALSAFQAECPEILKDSLVKGKDGEERYRYASLDTIVKQVKGLLAKHSFSYSFQTAFEQGAVVVSCIASHRSGHQERADFRASIEKNSYMGETQKWGAALTYAKRYSFCAVFGIMTADEDTDASPEKQVSNPAHKNNGDILASIGNAFKKLSQLADRETAMATVATITDAKHQKDIPAELRPAVLEALQAKMSEVSK